LKIAIVILNWNGEHYLKQFLPSVVNHSVFPDVEIVVADNASTDDSIEFLITAYPQVKIIKLEKNFGFAGGYNKALKQVKADYFILLNSDVEVTSEWIHPIINRMELDETIAAAMPKIKSFYEKEKFEYAGAAGGYIDAFGYPFCRGRILNTTETDDTQYNTPAEVFWASGACMFIRAELFFKSGGFDDYFFAHMEEIDLCWRLHSMGYKIMCFPDVEVFHAGGGTLPYNTPRKVFLNFRNNLLTMYKNLPWTEILPILVTRFIFDLLAACSFLLKFKFGCAFAILKAYFSFIANTGKYNDYRKIIKPRSAFTGKTVYQGSLILSYYLFGRRKFYQLFF
jgi:GT2 family glycosyltransferase